MLGAAHSFADPNGEQRGITRCLLPLIRNERTFVEIDVAVCELYRCGGENQTEQDEPRHLTR